MNLILIALFSMISLAAASEVVFIPIAVMHTILWVMIGADFFAMRYQTQRFYKAGLTKHSIGKYMAAQPTEAAIKLVFPIIAIASIIAPLVEA